jgi:hypothetical protein
MQIIIKNFNILLYFLSVERRAVFVETREQTDQNDSSWSHRRGSKKQWPWKTFWDYVLVHLGVANMTSYAICSEFDFGDSWQHDHWD